jgi:hypothetical protein
LPTTASNYFRTSPPFAGSGSGGFLLFLVDEGRAGRLSLDEDSLKKIWENVVRTITADEFTTSGGLSAVRNVFK